MRFFFPLLSALGLASAQLFSGKSDTAAQPKDLNLSATADFQGALSPLGLKLVNRSPTNVNLGLKNDEEKPVTLQFVGGSLWDAAAGRSVKNLTSVKLGNVVEPGSEFHVPYTINVDLAESELLLNLAMIVTTETGELVTVSAFNQTVSIVDPATSVFEPQMLFLYLLLASGFLGAVYAIYNTWVASVAPKKRVQRTPKVKSQVVKETVTTTSTGSSVFDESWIPEHHLKKSSSAKKTPTTPRVKSRKAT